MRCLIALLILLPGLVLAAPRITLPSSGGSGYNTIEDEGTARTQRTTLNFAGSGVSCADDTTKTTCTISAGTGSANVVAVTVDFGAGGNEEATTVVTGQTWVTATSVIACSATLLETNVNTRPEGCEDALLEGLTAAVYARVAGTGFTLKVSAAQGNAYNSFIFHCTGS